MQQFEIQEKLIQSATAIMNALAEVNDILAVYSDIGDEMALGQEYVDAGAAMIAINAALGTGNDSHREKLQRIRRT